MKHIEYCYPQGKRKALAFSYDDGVRADRKLISILNQHGLKGTFHLNSGLFGQGRRIAEREIADTYRGHEISCHSYSHLRLELLNDTQVLNQMIEDRKSLEKLAGYPVCGASYPYGTFSSKTVDIMRTCGIVCSRTVKSTENFRLPEDFMRWHPTCHHKNPRLTELWKLFTEKGSALSLFYLWGHSYEFDDDDNWPLIEDFCRNAGGHDDIFYATNMQIYDYIQAIRSLRFTVDENIVYNPGAASVWIEVDSRFIELKGGSTTNI